MNEKFEEILLFIGVLKERTNAKIIVHNFMVPIYSPLGILECKREFGFFESVRYLNTCLAEAFKEDNRVLVFDFDTFCSSLGKRDLIDYRMYYIGDIKLRFEHVPALCDKYLGYIRPILAITRKCIVLDLDNTLWGGVIGEDGIEGIKLGPVPEGRSFMEFQKYLLSLYNRGVILAINSKNNQEEALKVIREHPYMVLREEHFAGMQINWNDKITNMKAIADEINIGTDSLLFIDDDRLNREMIAAAMPEVRVIDLPSDPSLFVKTLTGLEDFNILQLTEEDWTKGKMCAEQRIRNELLHSSINITEYLAKLQMIVTIEEANNMNIPRIAQLTQKTNQFNMTTRRYQEDDILNKIKQDYMVVAVKVEDKFGDNGIIGVIIVEKGEQWRIDSFLLSCRVIGRKVEDTLLAYVLYQARKHNCGTIIGEFIPTKKNTPAKNFYRDSGFTLDKNIDGQEIWSFPVDKGYEAPSFIKMIER
jgi:FkbH-like protein